MTLFRYLDNCNKRRYMFKMIRREDKHLRALDRFYIQVWQDPVYGPATRVMIEQTQDRIFYYTNKLNALLR